MSDKNIILVLVIALIAMALWAHYNYMHRVTIVSGPTALSHSYASQIVDPIAGA